MFYKSDFKNVDSNYKEKGSQRIFKVEHKPISLNILSSLYERDLPQRSISNKNFENMESWWHRYCTGTSVHGIKYLVESDLHWIERVIWVLINISAILGIGFFSVLIAERFTSSPLSTVVESTNYPVSSIPYPGITVCNYNRINIARAREAQKILLPNLTLEANATYWKLIEILNNLEYGGFDEIDMKFLEMDLQSLMHVNLTELYEYTMFQCNEMFTESCWWRNKYVNCCSIMYRQRSEYGICYSFNSAVNTVGKLRIQTESNFPWRTSNYGDWSGLRMDINTSSSTMSSKFNGIFIIVHHPEQWPTNGYFIPTSTQTAVVIKPSFSYTTETVEVLSPDDRQCIYEKESVEYLWNLPGLKYFRSHCISECKQRHMYNFCNCSMDLFFPIGNLTACNIGNFKCLVEKNAILNYEKPPEGNQYFDDDEEGIVCYCLPECNRVEFSVEISPHTIATKDLISIDIHYQYATIVKYRTDVTFGWLDLIVAFGGIAGLFLGCSIISMVELTYFITLWLLNSIFNIKRIIRSQINRNNLTSDTNRFIGKTQNHKIKILRLQNRLDNNGIHKQDNINIIKHF